MSYDVGTFIDLSHLNRSDVEQLQAAPKRRMARYSKQDVDEAIERFTYKLVGNKFIKVRQIPVAYA